MFFPLFERHAAVIVDAASSLREMLAGEGQLTAFCQEVIARQRINSPVEAFSDLPDCSVVNSFSATRLDDVEG